MDPYIIIIGMAMIYVIERTVQLIENILATWF